MGQISHPGQRPGPAAAAFMLVAGLTHLAIAPLHWKHAPAHGLFFATTGLVQVLWAIVFWRRPSAVLSRSGMAFASGMITLWAITRILPAPFGDEPGEIEITGVVSNLSEALSFLALAAATNRTGSLKSTADSAWRMIGRAAIVGIAAGGFAYWLGMVAVQVVPGLAEAVEPTEVRFAENSAGESVPATSSEDSAAENPTDESPALLADDLQLVVAGIASPFANGGEVPVAGDVVAQLTFAAGDERYGRNLDVYLFRLDTSTALDDATIQATASMRFMDHGTFRVMALPIGDGHYWLPLQFPMPGEWQVELEIGAAGAQNTIYLDLGLFE